MAGRKAKEDALDFLFGAEEESKPRRRRVAAQAVPGAPGPSGPAMAGGPSGPAMAGGPSGPAMAGGQAGKPSKARKRVGKISDLS